MWREADDAALARLADDVIASDVCARLGLMKPPPRVAGLCFEARQLDPPPQGADQLAALVAAPSAEMPPKLLHHIALLHQRLATNEDLSTPKRDRHQERALSSWLMLCEEANYLSELALAVTGDEATAKTAAMDVAHARVRELAERAARGAIDRTDDARAALLTLSALPRLVEQHLSNSSIGESLLGTARRGRQRAIDAALAPIARQIEDASNQTGVWDRQCAPFADVIATWKWSGGHADVRRFAIDRATPIIWNIYRAKAWRALDGLLGKLLPLLEAEAEAIMNDPEMLAYAAACAQVLVFWSECSTSRSVRMSRIERALAVCPSHRNARAVTASFLLDDAIADMKSGLLTPRLRKKAEQRIARAKELFPQARRLEEAERHLARYV